MTFQLVQSRAAQIEAAAVVFLLVVGFNAGTCAYRNSTTTPHFYQAAFGPAVMVAAGRGFVNPVAAPDSALERFLGLRQDTITIEEAAPAAIVPLDQFQYAHRYAMAAVGYWWRVAGIAWSEVAVVVGAMHALSVVAVYALLRRFVPVALAVAGALWFGASPLQLGYAQQFREYAKSPFVLGAIPLIVVMTFSATSRRSLIATAAITGGVIGLGFGFKMDVAIMLPIAVLLVALFRDRRPWRGVPDKVIAAGVMAAAFFVWAGPILWQLSTGGSNVGHVALLGMGESFDQKLGVVPAPYRPFPYYDDNYVIYALRSRAEANGSGTIAVPSPEYEQAGMRLWREMLLTLPADALTRMFAGADRIMNLAFMNRDPLPVREPYPPARGLRAVFAYLDRWQGAGTWLAVGFVLAASAWSVRYGLFAAALLLLLAGYPALQFDARHYFHLQALPITVLIVMTSWAMTLAAGAIRRPDMARTMAWRPVAGRIGAVALILAGVLVLPLVALRGIQERQLRTAVDTFLDAPGETMSAELSPLSGDAWAVRWPGMAGVLTPAGDIGAAYYVAEFEALQPGDPIAMAIRHVPPLGSCPRVLATASDAGAVRLALPVYSGKGGPMFDGLTLGEEARKRLRRIYRVAAGPAGLPIEWRLAAQWRGESLFQSLSLEGRPAPFEVRIAADSYSCDAPLHYVDAMLAPSSRLNEADIVKRINPAARTEGQTLVMDGPPDPAYVVQFRPVTLEPGDALVASVSVREGGATVGLLQNDAWQSYVTLDRAGDAVVAVPAPRAGEYLPLVANAAPHERRSRFTIRGLAIVTHDGRRLRLGDRQPVNR